MRIAEVKTYRMELNEQEFNALRKLVADGLEVTEEVTPAMADVGKSLGIRTAESPVEKVVAQKEGR